MDDTPKVLAVKKAAADDEGVLKAAIQAAVDKASAAKATLARDGEDRIAAARRDAADRVKAIDVEAEEQIAAIKRDAAERGNVIRAEAEQAILAIKREGEDSMRAAEATRVTEVAAAEVARNKAAVDSSLALAKAMSEAAVAALPALGASRSAAEQAVRVLTSQKTPATPEGALAYDVKLRVAQEALAIARKAYQERLEAVRPEDAAALVAQAERQ